MDHIATHIPYLRRYGRALAGNQSAGDAYAAAVLEAMIADPDSIPEAGAAKVALYRMFHTIWHSSGAPVDEEEKGIAVRAQKHLSKLALNSREALLLHALEEFTTEEVAEIIGVSQSEAEELIRIGQNELAAAARGSVLIIEDEPIIAMDLEGIVSDAGHRVFGVAQTRAEAVDIGTDGKPDLVLADIQLADDSSGIDAVNDLLKAHGDVPVIFITAFPERLLTGEKPEPAFLITKPFRPEQVLSAISQALFFSSTQTLKS
ncbi:MULTISPECIES: response regulator [Halocynthiibacter]|uniref:Response regulator n=1 Tax=Halocynthiibacter halioticoli TaxID=2986804 RepID=A0AAE3J1K2_9RHOB|nr:MULTISPECIES: response regulator [Halocynthiibacter]MCV6824858.1 response regulator [Halocynthiibacter halioticoli]MCW4057859.1 response regulator [Halocynthiibacter sp. SDUM655004]